MSEVKWTSQQTQAIEAYGRGTAVSAAAGSGKTAVLIERIARLLSDEQKQIPADSLLAVTFTRDAAEQMRDKLNAAFEKLMASEPNNQWLAHQQNLLELAKISTINSFCLDLVKDNLHMFEFQGGLKILEDAQVKVMYEQAYAQAADEMCENDRESYELLYQSFGASKGMLENVAQQLYKFLRTVSSKKKWIESAQQNYKSPEKFQQLTDLIWRQAQQSLEEIKTYVDKFEYLLWYKADFGKEYKAVDCITGMAENRDIILDTYRQLKKYIENKDWDGMRGFKMEKFLTTRLKGIKKAEMDAYACMGDIKNEAAAVKKDVDKKVKKIIEPFKISKQHYRENMDKALVIFQTLVKFVERIEEICMEYKLEKNGLEFSDTELMAKQLLTEETQEGFKRTKLAEEIKSSGMYKIIVIDEFQDVNNLQELIFRAVSDSEDLSIMGKNVFFVGDMKQAIYKFRLTNPQLFQNNLNAAMDEKNSRLLQAINLNKNFRSREEIIDFCNFLFSNVMSLQCGGVDYTRREMLEFGAKYSSRSEPVEIMLVNDRDDLDKDLEIAQQSLAVAQRIRQLLDSKAPVFDNGMDRPCRAGDICVIVSTNDDIKNTAKALETVGLKAYCEDSKGYLKSREISLVMDILRIIDTPMNDISMTAVMLSPVMGFTADEIVLIRKKCQVEGKEITNHIYQVITGAAKNPQDKDVKESEYIDLGDEAVQKKCVNAFNLVESLRYDAMSMSLGKFIRKIYDVTDLMGIMCFYLDSQKKRANLQLLLEYACTYEENGGEGITGFLRFIDSVFTNENAFKQAVTMTNPDECVNVQTYHASKGLEYPYVLLCSLDSPLINEAADRGYIRLSSEEGVSFDFCEKRLNVKRENLYHKYLNKQTRYDLKSEKMRILYVGCTRAREKLIMVYSLKYNSRSSLEAAKKKKSTLVKRIENFEKIPPQIVRECSTMADWLTLALCKYKYRQPFVQWLGADVQNIAADESSQKVKIVFNEFNIRKDFEPAEKVQSQPAVSNWETVELLRKRYAFKYDGGECILPAKLTVTEIVNYEKEKTLGEKNPEFYPGLPRLSDELDKLTAAEKGTFTHKFMELADYENAQKNVRGELERLVSQGFFTPKEAQGVYVESLEKFFEGSFYERMKSSQDIRREQKFLVNVNDLDLQENISEIICEGSMIQGIADCIFKEDDGWVLVDYKTDNFKNEEEINEYKVQLQLYKAAFDLIYGQKVKSSYIYSFKLCKGVEFLL